MQTVREEAPAAAPAPEVPLEALEEEPEEPAGWRQGVRGLFRGDRTSLETRLLDQLAQERESTERMHAQRKIQEVAHIVRVEELTARVEEARVREAQLRARLEEVRERKEAIDEEASRLKFEGDKWAKVVREQNVAIRSAVEEAERLQREEAKLTVQVAEYDKANEDISKDLQTAKDLAAGYLAEQD